MTANSGKSTLNDNGTKPETMIVSNAKGGNKYQSITMIRA